MSTSGWFEWQIESGRLYNMDSSVPVLQSALKKHLQVAAIDFGTTFSGYAFSFRKEFEQNPLEVHAFNWQRSTGSLSSLKTPTCILFSPDKKFHSFGFEAEEEYAEKMEEDPTANWYFFKRFKMSLYNKEALNRKTLLEDVRGLAMPAMTVFSEAIRYLHDHLIKNTPNIIPSDVYWVLTVPAIWEDNAKMFMREAAVNAGIPTEHLSLALEPEVASLFCRHLPLAKLHNTEGDGSFSCFEPGVRYLVLDAGGGTIDITVHETQTDGNVREIYKANGGPWGGTSVDNKFQEFLVDLFGQDVIDAVMRNNQEIYLKLFQDFEIMKRTFDDDKDQVTFNLARVFSHTFKNMRKTEYTIDHIKEPLRSNVKLSKLKIRVNNKVVKGFFETTCQQIVGHLKDVLKMEATKDTTAILMVGGFSESKILQTAIKQEFSRMRIIIPEDAELAVVKGAVIFGHNPLAITARIARRTYGVSTYKTFDPQIHPPDRKEVVSGVDKCRDCFDKHVEIGQVVEVGQGFETKTYYPLYKSQTEVAFKVFTSHEKNPVLADDPPCSFLGKIDVDLSAIPDDDDKSMVVKMIYGEPELRVEVRVPKTNQQLDAKFDFLG